MGSFFEGHGKYFPRDLGDGCAFCRDARLVDEQHGVEIAFQQSCSKPEEAKLTGL